MSDQTNLNVLLDGIEERAVKAAHVWGSLRTDVPALVKLARLADKIISECDPATVWWWKHDSTAILQASSEPKEN